MQEPLKKNPASESQGSESEVANGPYPSPLSWSTLDMLRYAAELPFRAPAAFLAFFVLEFVLSFPIPSKGILQFILTVGLSYYAMALVRGQDPRSHELTERWSRQYRTLLVGEFGIGFVYVFILGFLFLGLTQFGLTESLLDFSTPKGYWVTIPTGLFTAYLMGFSVFYVPAGLDLDRGAMAAVRRSAQLYLGSLLGNVLLMCLVLGTVLSPYPAIAFGLPSLAADLLSAALGIWAKNLVVLRYLQLKARAPEADAS